MHLSVLKLSSYRLFYSTFFLCLFPSLFWSIKGRVDDNIETIRKRFKVFVESSLPVIEYYSSRGKVRKVIYFILKHTLHPHVCVLCKYLCSRLTGSNFGSDWCWKVCWRGFWSCQKHFLLRNCGRPLLDSSLLWSALIIHVYGVKNVRIRHHSSGAGSYKVVCKSCIFWLTCGAASSYLVVEQLI